MKKTLLLLFFLGILKAYSNPSDTLLFQLGQVSSDSERVELHCQLSEYYQLSEIKKAKHHAQQAEKLARQAGYKNGRAKAFTLLGYSHLVLGEYDLALNCHFQALQIAQQISDTAIMVNSNISLGTMYHKMKDSKRALQYYAIASRLAKKSNDELGQSRVYNNIGNIYEDKGKYLKALSCFRKAAKLQEALGHKRNWAISLHNIGNVHLFLGQPAKGLPYLFKSLEINKAIHNNMLPCSSLGSIAKIYQAIGNKDQALHYAKQSFALALETESSKKIAAAANIIQEVYAARKEYAQAYQYLVIFQKHNAKLDINHQKMVAAEITAQYEKDIKDLENKRLKAEQEKQILQIKKQQLTLALGVILLLVMLVLVWLSYQSQQRFKATSLQLQQANDQLLAQNLEINLQQVEIYSQSKALQKQNKQLEKHNQFKSKIFSIISHDLRAPFNSVKGILNYIQSQTLTAEAVKDIFMLLSKEMELSMNMLQNLLVWSKAQLEGSKVIPEPVQLQELVAENMLLLASQAREKDITLLNQVSANLIVSADKERLNFVLRNLLQNALKFTFVGGKITLLAVEAESQVTVSVCDNGKGIPAKNLAKLFTEDRFTTNGTANEKGTGLGLMLCKEMIESLQGSIAVESEEGNGCTFTIMLPKLPLVPDLDSVKMLAFQ